MKKVYIVEDHLSIREMLAETLKRNRYFVVGQSGNGEDALNEILELQPDLIIIDAKLPGISGLELLKKLKSTSTKARFLIYSAHENASLIKDMIEAGAHGFIEKTVSLKELINGINVISNGGTFFGPSSGELIRSFLINPQSSKRPKDFLTARETEVLQRIAEGYSTRDIAASLGLSAKTVDNHRTNMMRKLDLHNVASITRYALQNGMVELETSF